MAKKYEKIGQADIYREKKENGCIPVIGVAIAVIILLALLGQCSGS